MEQVTLAAQEIRARITEAEPQIAEVEAMIRLAADAGEPTSELTSKLGQLKNKISRWKKALDNQGL
jgi:uncharacterized protein HemY